VACVGWFQGLSNLFLTTPVPRLLLLAGTDRLDKPLMIGQMQGKFQTQILPQCGHAIQEDVRRLPASEVIGARSTHALGWLRRRQTMWHKLCCDSRATIACRSAEVAA